IAQLVAKHRQEVAFRAIGSNGTFASRIGGLEQARVFNGYGKTIGQIGGDGVIVGGVLECGRVRRQGEDAEKLRTLGERNADKVIGEHLASWFPFAVRRAKFRNFVVEGVVVWIRVRGSHAIEARPLLQVDCAPVAEKWDT